MTKAGNSWSSRVAAQIVSGIGFIGGGLIFVQRDVVCGLTTAAIIWLTAAAGMACGAGLPLLALGILDQDAIGRAVLDAAPKDCIVCAGDAVVMHPLILHSSARSRSSGHRRVVHLEYSSYELPTSIT